MTYELTNERYGNERETVTIDELRDLLREAFGDMETELEERADGIYEVDGEQVAEAELGERLAASAAWRA